MMVVRLRLKWYPDRNCWRKRRRNKLTGKVESYYLGKGECDGPDDSTGYTTAWAEWLQIKARLEAEEAAHAKEEEANQPKSMAAIFEDLDADLERQPSVNLEALLAAYLGKRQAEVQAGQVTPATFLKVRAKLDTFAAWCQEAGIVSVFALTESTLERYRTAQLALVGQPKDQGGIGKVAVRERLEMVRAFIWHLYETRRLEHLPRNLRSFVKLKVDPPQPKFWTLTEVRQLFRAASPDMRVYLGLALNCGWTQTDISSLEHSMIDWKTGIVRRPRHKTNVETAFKLWGWLLKLLREQATPGPDGLVLTAKGGSPLLLEQITASGKGSRRDDIADQFRALRDGLGLDKAKSYKHLRKTSANMLAKEYQSSPQIERQFLGHVRPGLTKHYSDEHHTELFAALDWLDGQFALAKEVEGI